MLADGPLYVDVITTRLGSGAQEEQLNEFVTIYRVDVPPIDPVDHYNSVVESNQLLVEHAERLAAKQPYDLIHAHYWLVAKAGILLKHSWKAPYVSTIHATERGRHQGHIPSDTSHQIDRMEWQSCFEAWTVIACSEFMQHELEGYFGLPSSKVVVIPTASTPRRWRAARPTSARCCAIAMPRTASICCSLWGASSMKRACTC